MSHDYIHQNRRLSQSNASWIQQFACEDIDCLIICRGPIRKEVMDVFTEMGAKYSMRVPTPPMEKALSSPPLTFDHSSGGSLTPRTQDPDVTKSSPNRVRKDR